MGHFLVGFVTSLSKMRKNAMRIICRQLWNRSSSISPGFLLTKTNIFTTDRTGFCVVFQAFHPVFVDKHHRFITDRTGFTNVLPSRSVKTNGCTGRTALKTREVLERRSAEKMLGTPGCGPGVYSGDG